MMQMLRKRAQCPLYTDREYVAQSEVLPMDAGRAEIYPSISTSRIS